MNENKFLEPAQKSKFNFYVFYLGITLAAAAMLIVFSILKNQKVDKIAENLPQGISLARFNDMPQGFPDVPLNGKIELNHSYTLTYKNQSQDQKIIDFASAKSVKENVDFYKDWAEKNNWDILYQSADNEDEARLAIERNKRPLNITIIKNKTKPEFSDINMSW